MKTIFYLLLIITMYGCATPSKTISPDSRTTNVVLKSTVVLKDKIPARVISTKNTDPEAVMNFAETLQGIPYLYGSADKEKGFDCSGFINYVFNHFKIKVPRTSKDFTNAGQEVASINSRRGDIILFTGTDIKSGVVGHMGLITENKKGVIRFIHASSGKNGGVIISGINSYYLPRFVKIIRVFNKTTEVTR